MKEKTQTVQQTSKVWKLGMLFGAILSAGSCVGVLASDDPRTGANFIWALLFGALLWGVSKLLAWWNHG